jgi:hypothetical protein
MRAERLVEKLQLEADLEFKRKWTTDRQKIVERSVRKPETKSQQCRKQLSQLRANTAEIERELDLRKEVESESRRNLEARMKLLEANRSPEEKKAQAEEIRRGQILFSRIVPENHPDWRAQATAEFLAKKLV